MPPARAKPPAPAASPARGVCPGYGTRSGGCPTASGMSRQQVTTDFATLTGADPGQITVRKIRGPSWRRNYPAPGR